MDIIKVNNLIKIYGDYKAVDHISFTVEQGSLLGFLGVNGAGKTTVINMLATLLKPDGGSAEICGEILGKDDQRIRRKIGIVYQQNCLDDVLTVEENLLCRGIVHGATKKEAKRQYEKLSAILKLDEIRKKKYRVLSGGQKRRCEIAAALMHTPELLFLDEPTTGLDPATRMDVWSTIQSLQETEKMTVFLTTHYMEEATRADKIIILDHGKIVASDTPFALKSRYTTDRLKLYCKEEKIESICKKIKNPKVIEQGMIELVLPSTMYAIPILQEIQQYIQGFEVIQGDMDDVFLNAVGREIHEGRGE